MKDIFDLSQRCAIVTGAGGLLGFQHCRALLALNCHVHLWDIDSLAIENAVAKLQIEFRPDLISSSYVDVSNEESIRHSLDCLLATQNKVDILINNAALNPKFGSSHTNFFTQFERYSTELWNLEIAVGLTGAMLCSKLLGTHMTRHGGGVILNIASDLSVIAPDQRLYEIPDVHEDEQFKKPVSYSVIKSGLVGLTKYLATYWADKNIRVNSLSPGGVFEGQSEQFISQISRLIPMQRMAEIDEYIGAIQFLCSDASRYMTGQNLVIDGGRSVW